MNTSDSPAVAPASPLHPTFAGICRTFVNNAAGTPPAAEAPTIWLCPITVGWNVRQPERMELRDISYVMSAIQGGSFEKYDLKSRIIAIRAFDDDEPQRRVWKQNLPWFCGSVIKDKRSNSNVQHAQFMIFDLDHVADIEATKALAVAKFPWVRYAFRSVNDGVKLIAQFKAPITDEAIFREIYHYLALQISTLLKIPCDATPDWARACFMSYDPLLIDNFSRLKKLDAKDIYRQAVSFRELMPPKQVSMVKQESFAPSQVTNAVPAILAQRTHATHYSPSRMSPSARENGSKSQAPTGQNDSCSSDYAKAAQVVSQLARGPIDYRDWIKVGLALYAGFGEGGKALWDTFKDNPHYRDSQRVIDTHWQSFRSVRAVTLPTLFYIADKYGVSHE